MVSVNFIVYYIYEFILIIEFFVVKRYIGMLRLKWGFFDFVGKILKLFFGIAILDDIVIL